MHTRTCVRACVRVFFSFFSPLFRRGLKSYSSESFHKYSTWLCKFAQPASTFVNLCDVCAARVGCENTVYYIANTAYSTNLKIELFLVENNATVRSNPTIFDISVENQ